MRTFELYSIIRLLLWRPTYLIIAGLFGVGWLASVFFGGPKDLVCVGAKEYDLNNPGDLEEIRNDLVGVSSLDVIQRPPCNFSGSRVYEPSLEKIFGKADRGSRRSASD